MMAAMIRHTIFFGSLIGCAVAVPLVYQGNADFFRDAWRGNDSKTAAYSVSADTEPNRSSPSMSGQKVVIPMDERGHFQSDFKMNGRKVHAMIDTGATYVAINRSTANKIGVRVSPQDMTYSVTTANGATAAAAIIINEVAIGRIRINNVPALVLDDSALDGILMGMSFLKELDRFTIENRTLIMQQ
jgi:aspartyl protease family protein